jgi:UDP-N-acetylmuramoylalanine--D-glutamate ligase
MYNIENSLLHKKIGIMGLARSGIAAAKKLTRLGCDIFLSDAQPKEKIANLSEIMSFGDCEFGGHTKRLLDMDIIIVSPGIRYDIPLLVEAKEKGILLWSEIELGYRLTHKDTKIIAVTGSNGKSTVASLIHHILKSSGFDTILAGNIGDAYTSFDIEKPRDFIVLEVSSFQLDLIDSFRPDIATILNITPDHLDRYTSFEEYALSKFRIHKNQSENDTFILNCDDDMTMRTMPKAIKKMKSQSADMKSGLIFFGNNPQNVTTNSYYSDDTISVEHYTSSEKKVFSINNVSELPLKGPHNIQNIMASLLATSHYIDPENIFDTIMAFPPLEHRLEPVTTHRGVLYINDSKATNTDSLRYALKSYDRPLHLIIGGSDKGEDLSVLKSVVDKNVKKLYLIGETAQTLYSIFYETHDCAVYLSFSDAISDAVAQAVKGDVVILCPACASFDWFQNFEHRGRVFKETVMKLTDNK